MNLFVLHLLGQSFIHSLYITHSVSHSVTQGCNLFLFFLHITQQYKVSNSMQTLSLSLFYPFNCLYYYLFVYCLFFCFRICQLLYSYGQFVLARSMNEAIWTFGFRTGLFMTVLLCTRKVASYTEGLINVG